MAHPLIDQLRFTRSEFRRGLVGIINSWNIGHLTWQEQRYWLLLAQNKVLLPWVIGITMAKIKPFGKC